jgi:hypothetical protein
MSMQDWVWGELACVCERVHNSESNPPCLFCDYIRWGAVRQQLLDKNSEDAAKHRKKGSQQKTGQPPAAAATAAGAGEGEPDAQAAAAQNEQTAHKRPRRTRRDK